MKTFFLHIVRMLYAWTYPVRLILSLLFTCIFTFAFILACLLSVIFLLKEVNPLTYWMRKNPFCFNVDCGLPSVEEHWEENKNTWINR